MNIDITNYLSTIKHISNGANSQRQLATYSKPCGNNITVSEKTAQQTKKDINFDDSRINNKINIDDVFKNNKKETITDIFIDDDNGIDDTQVQPPHPNYLPIKNTDQTNQDSKEEGDAVC